MTICVLGRQPEIGLAELESIFGADKVHLLGGDCAAVDTPVELNRLGGSFKTATQLAEVKNDRHNITRALEKCLLDLEKELPEGKINLGLSFHNSDLTPYTVNGVGLNLKKALKRAGRPVRIVPNEAPTLSSAQTYHNKLAGNERGVELLVVKNGKTALIGRVSQVQDIDSYRLRDRERPKRDAFVGMLPPKLAQIMINLAVGTPASQKTLVLDPFCGTGVILQEAQLMNYSVYGTDISQKMIDYSKTNLEWLKQTASLPSSTQARLELADATKYHWEKSLLTSNLFVVSETYLGQPLGGQHPTDEQIQQIIHDTNRIVRDFLKNLQPQLPAKARLCIAIPAWFIDGKLYHLPVASELVELGFTERKFNHAAKLIYRRDDQITGRQLLVLEKV